MERIPRATGASRGWPWTVLFTVACALLGAHPAATDLADVRKAGELKALVVDGAEDVKYFGTAAADVLKRARGE